MTYSFDWPCAHGFLKSTGSIKQWNADFVVKEQLPESPSGEGEHLWLTVEKDGQNTAWVARQLASWAGIGQRDVSYAGLKDRHAVTEQTFSLHMPGKLAPSLDSLNIDGVRVVAAHRHNRKLKTGQLIGNHFTIRVRQCSLSAQDLGEYWQQICQHGVPNYFGPQRFGHGGQNVTKGVAWLVDGAKVQRQQQSIYLSAVRSFLFNKLLASRVVDKSWSELKANDFAQFSEGKAGFYCELPEQNDIQRCRAGQLSPSASLPGLSKDQFSGLDERELLILDEFADVMEALKERKVMRHFRKLRVIPEQPSFDIVDNDPVFSFFLPAGCFATSILAEMFDISSTTEAKDWNE